MSFGEQLRKRREELGISRVELAGRLGISRSAVGNYETGVSAPKEEVLLRLFDALGVDPNYLYRDAYRAHGGIRSDEEQALLEGYRRLSLAGRQTVHTMVRALEDLQQESERLQPRQDPRTIPLYASPAAAGYAAPVFNEDYETIPVTGQVPRGAELAVRIQGDSMEPYIHDGGVVYVNHDPAQRRRGHFLRGRRHGVQAVLPGPPGHGVSVQPEPLPGRRRRAAAPQQRAQSHLLRPGHAPWSASAPMIFSVIPTNYCNLI